MKNKTSFLSNGFYIGRFACFRTNILLQKTFTIILVCKNCFYRFILVVYIRFLFFINQKDCSYRFGEKIVCVELSYNYGHFLYSKSVFVVWSFIGLKFTSVYMVNVNCFFFNFRVASNFVQHTITIIILTDL